jgi:hypothetical protein
MKVIAHRGLLDGPNKGLENSPIQIEAALSYGLEVEVDVWWVAERAQSKFASRTESHWMLGHDSPMYPVSQEFLERDGIWVHCKNSAAMDHASDAMHYFWHQTDDVTITSRGYFWSYPGKELRNKSKSVMVLPEINHDMHAIPDASEYYRVCTDYAYTMGVSYLRVVQ